MAANTDEEHIKLHRVLSQVKGKVAISGYHCDLMDELYQDWYIHEEGTKKAHSIKTERAEVLWTNYEITPNTKNNRLILFDRVNSLISHRRAWANLLKQV
jgi:DNA adenine methylase